LCLKQTTNNKQNYKKAFKQTSKQANKIESFSYDREIIGKLIVTSKHQNIKHQLFTFEFLSAITKGSGLFSFTERKQAHNRTKTKQKTTDNQKNKQASNNACK